MVFTRRLRGLDILSFAQTVFLNKANIMYKIYNNLAPTYLQELFQMRDVNLDNTASNLRSVTQELLIATTKMQFIQGYFIILRRCGLEQHPH